MRLLLTISLFICSLAASATNYYISNSGSNSNAGTSPGAAWQFSKLSSVTLSSGDSILFNRGETFYGSITSANTNGIKYGAYGTGLMPVITGFTNLTTWTHLGSNIWEASLNSGTILRMVTVNNVQTAMGRYPNFHPTTGGYLTIDSHSGTSQITDAALPSSPDWDGATLVYRRREWVWARNLITSHSGTTINFTTDDATQAPIDGMGYFIQNHVTTLDAQNEWYYNPTAYTIRMYSTVNPSTLNVKASTFEKVVNMSDRSNVSFSNIRFEGGDLNTVFVERCTNVSFYNCEVDLSGEDGMRIDNCNSPVVRYTHINRSYNTGVNPSNSTGPTVEHCQITNSGTVIGMNRSGTGMMCGITFGDPGSGGTTSFSYNRVDSSGNSGIVYRGDNVNVGYNLVRWYGVSVKDCGGIYTNGDETATGRVVRNNIVLYGYGNHVGSIHSEPGGTIAFYADDFSNGIEYIDNIAAYNTRNGVLLHNSRNITLRGNIFYRNKSVSVLFAHDWDRGAPYSPMTTRGMIVKNNVFWQEAGKIIQENGNIYNDIDQHFTSIDSNYYARSTSGKIIEYNHKAGGGVTYVNYTLPEWKAAFPAYDPNSLSVTVPESEDSIFFQYNWSPSPVVASLSAKYKDAKGTQYNSGSVTVPAYGGVLLYKYAAANVAPTANAGTDITQTFQTSPVVNLNGTGSNDPDGTMSYTWSKVSGPAVSFSSTTVANPAVTVSSYGTYVFRLQVTDNDGSADDDTVVVNVRSLPTANAGADQAITLPTNTTTLNGSASTDPDGTISTYAWSKVFGPSFSINNAALASPTLSSLLQGAYSFRLVVTDNHGLQRADTMTLIVNAAPNVPPVANAGNDRSLVLPTNSLSLSGAASADTDGTIASYLWTQQSGPNTASFSSFTVSAPNVTGLIQGVYIFRLLVTDNSGATHYDEMTVTVNPSGNAVPVVAVGVDKTITLPVNVVQLNATATDSDGTIVSTVWTKLSGPAYTINNPNAMNPFITLAAGTYVFRLTATDNDGGVSHDDITIIVNPDPAAGGYTLPLPGNVIIRNL